MIAHSINILGFVVTVEVQSTICSRWLYRLPFLLVIKKEKIYLTHVRKL